jgi:hypothetical protein
MKTLVAIILGYFACITGIHGAAEYCPTSQLCVQTKVASNATSIDIIVKTKLINGYVSVGLGSSMRSGDVVVCSR